MEKHYYLLEFTQCSPLRISAGFGEETDVDLIRDRQGLPFLPGSGLAGVLRSEFDEKTANGLFGFAKADGNILESRLLVSDAVLPAKAAVRISRRDGVGLNERKTAVTGAKYDFEVVETDEPYRAVLELTDESFAEKLRAVLARWCSLGVSFGARTTRGYGRMTVSVRDRCFVFPEDLDTWLDFDPFGDTAFNDCDPWTGGTEAPEGQLLVSAVLELEGTFSVRSNTSALVAPGDTVAPDTVPMENRAGEPVIPGTSWAGAFLHHMRALADELGLRESDKKDLDALFGTGGEKKMRSPIRFSETAVKGSRRKLVTRTAIDRFTAAPRNRALFISEVAFGGTGELLISLPAATSALLKGLLGAALYDLDCGLLGFGGENGAGRGIARIKRLTVNGKDRTETLRNGGIRELWEEASE